MSNNKPDLYTCLSPALLHLYDVRSSVVVIIDVLRATSTIAAALDNGAECIVPVESVAECIRLGNELQAITAGERDGKVAEGLSYGNSPFEYPKEFITGKKLVLTTTNGTKLLHMALAMGAREIITGSFANHDAVCSHLLNKKIPVVLACAAWKDKVNMEDTLFAGSVISRIKNEFNIPCDSSKLAESLYNDSAGDFFEFMKTRDASHYQRLMGFGLERDIRHCLQKDTAPVLPVYRDGMLIKGKI